MKISEIEQSNAIKPITCYQNVTVTSHKTKAITERSHCTLNDVTLQPNNNENAGWL